jgi:citrate synthase
MSEFSINGQPISRLMREGRFVDVAWQLWTGKQLDEKTRKLIETCLIASIDHGEAPPSAQATLGAASAGKSMSEAVAAGMLTIGPKHGNAAGAAGRWVKEALVSGVTADAFASNAIGTGLRIPGIGHREYEIDPRTQEIIRQAKELLPSTKHLDFITEVSRAMTEKKGKALPVNVDGAMGALMVDMGESEDLADMIFLCARSFGLAFHASPNRTV